MNKDKLIDHLSKELKYYETWSKDLYKKDPYDEMFHWTKGQASYIKELIIKIIKGDFDD